MTLWRWLLVLSLAAEPGCVGGLGDDGLAGPPGATTTTTPPPPPITTCDAAAQARAASSSELRRLSAPEYRASIATIFDGRVPASDAYPALAPSHATGYSTEFGLADIGQQELSDCLDAADEVAVHVAEAIDALLPCASATPDRACASDFVQRYARRAYRRAPTADEQAALLATFDAGQSEGATFPEAIALVTSHMLSAPQFIYIAQDAAPMRRLLTGPEAATWLSFLLFDAPPDDALLARAEDGSLSDEAAIVALATEMLDDPRASVGLARLMREWLGADRVSPANRSTTLYRDYTEALSRDLADSFDRTATASIAAGDSLETMLARAPIAIDGELGPFLGVTGEDAAWHGSSALPGGNGLLAHPALMAALSHSDGPAYVLRGRLVRKRVLCGVLGAPPTNAGSIASGLALPADPTARDRSLAIRSIRTCANCHDLMDPAGLAFEPFDAVGRFRRTDELGRAFDVSDTLAHVDAGEIGFTDHRELVSTLAASDDVTSCFARQVVRFAFSRLDDTADTCVLGDVRAALEAGSVRDAVIAFVSSQTTLHREAP